MLRLLRTAAHFYFEVNDTGPGIPTERQQAIFEPFQQDEEGLSIALTASVFEEQRATVLEAAPAKAQNRRRGVFVKIAVARLYLKDVLAAVQSEKGVHCPWFRRQENWSCSSAIARQPSAPCHLNELRAYDWPGNIRELQNVIERAVIVSQNGALHLDLPNRSVVADLVVEEQQSAAVVPNTPNAPIAKSYADLKDLEREMVLQALRAAEGKVSGRNGAAERLGIHPSTLTSKMAIMGIKMRAVFAGK